MGVLLKRPHWNTSLAITVKAAAGSRGKCKDSFKATLTGYKQGSPRSVERRGRRSGLRADSLAMRPTPTLDRNSPV